MSESYSSDRMVKSLLQLYEDLKIQIGYVFLLAYLSFRLLTSRSFIREVKSKLPSLPATGCTLLDVRKRKSRISELVHVTYSNW